MYRQCLFLLMQRTGGRSPSSSSKAFVALEALLFAGFLLFFFFFFLGAVACSVSVVSAEVVYGMVACFKAVGPVPLCFIALKTVSVSWMELAGETTII